MKARRIDDADYSYDETEQQEHEGVLDANGRLTVTVPTQVDGKHNDQDYRIEARVTDAANREVSGHSTVLATYGSFRLTVEPTSYVFEPGQTRQGESDRAGLRRQARTNGSAHCLVKPCASGTQSPISRQILR